MGDKYNTLLFIANVIDIVQDQDCHDPGKPRKIFVFGNLRENFENSLKMDTQGEFFYLHTYNFAYIEFHDFVNMHYMYYIISSFIHL